MVTGGCWSAWPSESGFETPTAEDLARLDRKRKGKKLMEPGLGLSQSATSEDDMIYLAQDSETASTHLAYKPEHAVNQNTGAVVAADGTPGRRGRTRRRWRRRWRRPSRKSRGGGRGTDCRRPGRMCDATRAITRTVGLKGALMTAPGKRRIWPRASRKVLRAGTSTGRPAGQSPTNRTRLLSGVATGSLQAAHLRSVERSFAHNLNLLDGMRRTWLRGRENVHKRYLLHVDQPQSGVS